MALVLRVALLAGTSAVVLLATGMAGAQGAADSASCDQAFSSGPELTKGGKLVAARSALARCSSAPCPASMRPLCAEDLRLLEERIPSAVFIAKGPAGEDMLDVRVSEGDAVVTDVLDGKSVPLDPGPHRFHFARSDGTTADVDVVVHEGERARAITATLAPAAPASRFSAAPAPPPEPERPVPWTVFASGGLTVASGATFGIFGVRGIVDRSDLAGCRGSCSQASVNQVTTNYTIANVGLGVGIGALVLTTILYLTRPARGPDSAVPAAAKAALEAGSRGVWTASF
jgi:hypothetical protein